MKNFKKLMMLATVACIAQQSTIANNKTADDTQPTHQGVGRLGTFFENTLTLHPGNAVNALVTGDQSDTTFGWHENEEGRIKANRADTEHNNNKNVSKNQLDSKNDQNQGNFQSDQDIKNKDQQKTRGHWFWKSDQ